MAVDADDFGRAILVFKEMGVDLFMAFFLAANAKLRGRDANVASGIFHRFFISFVKRNHVVGGKGFALEDLRRVFA